MIALTRAPSPLLDRCELTHLARRPIDVARAAVEHAAYEAQLRALGCDVRRLPPCPDLPDGAFVEDLAVVLPEVAILCRPGAPSRRPEAPSVAEALAGFTRPVVEIQAPGTLEGGDVLVLGRTVWVGRTGRTSDEGVGQLAEALLPLGYQVQPIDVSGCLHLKTAVTAVADDLLLLNPAWVDPTAFGLAWLAIDPEEPFAANVVRVGDHVVGAEAHASTRRRLERAGVRVHAVDVTQLSLAEAGPSCLSVLVPPG